MRLLNCILVGLFCCILVAFKDDFDRRLSVFVNILLKESFRIGRWDEACSSFTSFSLFFCSSIHKLLNIIKHNKLPVSPYSFPPTLQIKLLHNLIQTGIQINFPDMWCVYLLVATTQFKQFLKSVFIRMDNTGTLWKFTTYIMLLPKVNLIIRRL